MKPSQFSKPVFLLFLILPSIVHAQWTGTNGPEGGYVRSMTVDSSGWIYAASHGGVFRSTDSGQNWQEINEGLTNEHLRCIQALPTGTVLAGSLLGLYRSTNKGDTWTPVFPQTYGNYDLASDIQGNILLACDAGIFRSTDDGENWSSQSDLMNIYSLAFGDSTVIFAAGYGGGFRSMDFGSTWTQLTGGLPSSNLSTVIASSNGTVFAGSYTNGVYRSTDNGNTWQQRNSGLSNLHITAFMFDTPQSVFVSTLGGFFRSTNEGSSWFQANSGVSPSYIGILCMAKQGGTLLGGSDGVGVYRSRTGGQNWNRSNSGLVGTVVNALVNGPSGQLFAATFGGVFITTNGGNDWSTSNNGISNLFVRTVFVAATGYLFAGTASIGGPSESGVYRSVDGGQNWTWSSAGFAYTWTDIKGFAATSNDQLFVATNDYVYRSTDNGASWVQSTTGLPTNFIQSIAVDPGDGVYVGTLGDGIFRSTNGSLTWTAINSGLGNLYVDALAINSLGYLFAGTNGHGVFRSTDRGASWEQVLIQPPYLSVSNISINEEDELYVAISSAENDDIGVWRSTDAGTTWDQLLQGLGIHASLNSLCFDDAGYLYAGSNGGGVFRSDESTTAVKSMDRRSGKQPTLSQNYPNPFNPSTVISYELPANTRTTLTIYNVLGQEVRTLVDGPETVGAKSVTWDGRDNHGRQVVSGVYLYRLQAGSYVQARKMILMK